MSLFHYSGLYSGNVPLIFDNLANHEKESLTRTSLFDGITYILKIKT